MALRAFYLLDDFDRDTVARGDGVPLADLEDGVLTISVPKTKASSPKRAAVG